MGAKRGFITGYQSTHEKRVSNLVLITLVALAFSGFGSVQFNCIIVDIAGWAHLLTEI
uniref:Uncharacterized protein n=1 Tax=Rhizophora mucronata TaxID=61149 RepID=A0A2P2QJF0_RHIMU